MREVHDAIAQRKPALYTTVLKMLQIMTEKALVRRDERQRAHVYRASQPREWTQRQLAGDLLRRAFGGSASSLLLGVLSAQKATPEEMAEIRRMIEKHEKEER